MQHDTHSLIHRLEQLEQDNAAMRRRSRVMMALAFLALVGVLLASPGSRKALAQQTGGIPDLTTRVAALEATVANLQNQINNVSLTPGPQGPAGPAGPQGPQGDPGTPADMTRVAALEAKTQYVTVSDGEMFITGTNLHILNGLGSTNTANSYGNLIIGYNETRPLGYVDIRTGSHNLILGGHQNYSSWGGLVAGFHNEISGQYASVSGGQFNIAGGTAASVSGGSGSTASGDYASVSGGNSNIASGFTSSVSGGQQNTASSVNASVSGGGGITQSNPFGWSAGSFHTP